MEFNFCPELQAAWCLKEISFTDLKEIKVVLYESSIQQHPSVVGRQSQDIMTYPEIYLEKNETEFYFKACVYFNIRDERAPGYAENDSGEGKTFQRLLDSELVKIHTDRVIDNVIHYRIYCLDEIIDVVCQKPPEIVRKSTT